MRRGGVEMGCEDGWDEACDGGAECTDAREERN